MLLSNKINIFLSEDIFSVYKRICVTTRSFIQHPRLARNTSTKSQNNKNSDSKDPNSSLSEEDMLNIYDLTEKEMIIEEKRNKSRLNPQHYNMLHNKVPYKEPMTDIHHTIQYKRRMFGRYGKESNLNPGTLWPTQQELQNSLEYEKVAHPFTIQEMIEKALKKKEEEQKEIEERQLKIEQNLQQLDEWKQIIAKRLAKKLAEAEAAKAKKDALIEEVRQHFGYNVDIRDEKFKEMLAQKEKDEKKKRKEEKAKARQERVLSMKT